MDRYEEEADDSDNETDPEQLLNEWLGELDSLTVVSPTKVSFDRQPLIQSFAIVDSTQESFDVESLFETNRKRDKNVSRKDKRSLLRVVVPRSSIGVNWHV
ncbi:amyloid beta A4 precursor protein-binding family B member 1-interacting protein-like isoform X4, partial [Vespula squamosa]